MLIKQYTVFKSSFLDLDSETTLNKLEKYNWLLSKRLLMKGFIL